MLPQQDCWRTVPQRREFNDHLLAQVSCRSIIKPTLFPSKGEMRSAEGKLARRTRHATVAGFTITVLHKKGRGVTLITLVC